MNLMARFRRRRMRRFVQLLGIREETRVLDVGGTTLNWTLADGRPRLVLVNMPRAREAEERELWVAADGRRLPFADHSFDVVFSNSVIEHVGTAVEQRRFASEIARVGKRYWVQTPNRWFPLELHMLTPFVHYLPRNWQAGILRRFTIWEWIARPDPDQRAFYIEHYLRDVRLLRAKDLQSLFPGAELIRERFFGFTKSLIAARRS
jgi:ubiquinone/menaquinone biosynthesis C-methylase UbiE